MHRLVVGGLSSLFFSLNGSWELPLAWSSFYYCSPKRFSLWFESEKEWDTHSYTLCHTQTHRHAHRALQHTHRVQGTYGTENIKYRVQIVQSTCTLCHTYSLLYCRQLIASYPYKIAYIWRQVKLGLCFSSFNHDTENKNQHPDWKCYIFHHCLPFLALIMSSAFCIQIHSLLIISSNFCTCI